MASLPSSSYLLLLLFVCVLFLPLCAGRTLYWGDILLYFAPMWRWEQSALRQGHIPLWNSAVLSGQPFLGNPQEGVFYPAALALPFVPMWLYISLMVAVHIFLCGVFMMRYLRRWTKDWQAAFAGALVYMGSACLIGRAQFPPMIVTSAYFPLLLCSLDRCLDTDEKWRRPGNTLGQCHTKTWNKAIVYDILASRLQLALVVGLLLLAAHPQLAYIILAFAGSYALCRKYACTCLHDEGVAPGGCSIWRNLYKTLRGNYSSISSLCAAAVTGMLLAAAQILPAMQLFLASPREQFTPAQANRFVLEPLHLLTLLFPHFQGHPTSSDYWGGGNAWESAIFVGWLPLLLIGSACLRIGSSRFLGFWTASAVAGVWLALGRAGGIYWIAFRVVPGMSNFHDPARFLFYTTFAFGVLTAAGWERAANRLRRAVQKSGRSVRSQQSLRAAGQSVSLAILAVPLLWYGQEWNPTAQHDVLQRRPTRLNALLSAQNAGAARTNELAATYAGRVYLPAKDLFWKRYITEGYSDYGSSDTRSIQALLESMLPNIGIADGLRSASGYEPVPIFAQTALDGIGRQAMRRSEPNLSRVTMLMNVRTLLLPRTLSAHDPRFRPKQTLQPLSVSLWSNRDALSSAWLVHHTRHIEGKRRIVAALSEPDFHPDKLAIICDARQGGDLDLEWLDTLTISSPGGIERTVNRRTVSNSRASKRNKLTSAKTGKEEISDNRISDNRSGSAEPRYSPVTLTSAYTTEMMYDVQYNVKPSMLVIAQTAYPGWKALVDDKPAALHRVDASLVGIYLSAGHHRVCLVYRPASYQAGLYLSLAAYTICAMACGVLLGIRRRI